VIKGGTQIAQVPPNLILLPAPVLGSRNFSLAAYWRSMRCKRATGGMLGTEFA
jgi:hypothetical protein